ncbi:MAG TPA: hypothetical protein VF744_18845 [Beijerinckiaceae bacterium]|jgi:hypothetical protein
MRHLIAAAGLIACAAFAVPPANAAPAAQAAPVALDTALGSLPDVDTAYVKKGGKGWKGGKAMKRRGPPPWAPAWGRRYRR